MELKRKHTGAPPRHTSRRTSSGASNTPGLSNKKRRKGASGDTHDDSEGHILIKAGQYLGNYQVVREAGKGTFGKVYVCKDSKDGLVAIKVVRSVKKYTDAARVEARILREVNDRDPDNKSGCVRYYERFTVRGHVCMVFESLGHSLYEYIKVNKYSPLPLYCVQNFADQLVFSIAYLHAMKLTHTDLKPENILLTTTSYRTTSKRTSSRGTAVCYAPEVTTIKLIDFGGATFDHQHKSSIINTRQYRAPEVILNLGWTTSSDMWSVGCIIMELYTGELLFATHDTAEHLALMEACLGRMPSSMACAKTREARRYFDSRGRMRYPDGADSESIRHVHKMRRLRDIVHPDDTVFFDFVQRCLEFDPSARITAAEAVNHPFFKAVRGAMEPLVPAPLGHGSSRDDRRHRASKADAPRRAEPARAPRAGAGAVPPPSGRPQTADGEPLASMSKSVAVSRSRQPSVRRSTSKPNGEGDGGGLPPRPLPPTVPE